LTRSSAIAEGPRRALWQ